MGKERTVGKSKTLQTLSLALFLLASISSSLYAEWSDDPSNCTPISIAENFKMWPQLIETTDGYIVGWVDERRGTGEFRDFYAQKFTVDGDMLWATDGLVIAAGPENALLGNEQIYHSLISDNEGGALLQWTDYQIYIRSCPFMTRASSLGEVQWGDPGVEIQDGDTAVIIYDDQPAITRGLVPDTEDGGFSYWTAGYSVPFIQRLTSSGVVRSNWGLNLSGIGWHSLITAGEQEGIDSVLFAYVHGLDPYVTITKVTDPETNWPSNQDAMQTEWEIQTSQTEGSLIHDAIEIIADNAGGAFLAWVENYDLFQVQKVSPDGGFNWPDPGVKVTNLEGEHRFTRMTPDGEGGIIIVWEYRSLYNPDHVYAQRISSNGQVLWGKEGIMVSAEASGGQKPQVILSSEGNYIVVYHQEPYGLVAQKLAGNGTFLWGAEGKLLSTTFMLSDWEKAFDIASDNQGGVIAVFTGRVGTDVVDKIYGARIYEDLPDLTIPRVTVSSMWEENKQIMARVTIANVGEADLPAGQEYTLSIFLDDINSEELARETLTDALAINQSTTVRVRFKAPASNGGGNHRLLVVIDADSSIAEGNENNNVYDKNIRYR